MNLNPTLLSLVADARFADDHAIHRTQPERGRATVLEAPRHTSKVVNRHYFKRMVARLFPA